MILAVFTLPLEWDVDVVVPKELIDGNAFVQAVVTVWRGDQMVYQTVTPYFVSALRYLN